MSYPFASALELQVSQLQASKTVVDALVAGAERIDHIVLQSVKEALHAQLSNAEALAAVRSPRDLLALGEHGAGPNFERALFRYGEILRALTDTYVALVSASRVCVAAVDSKARNVMVPPLPETALANPLAGMFDFWNAAWRQLNDLTRPLISPAAAEEQETLAATSVRKSPGRHKAG